MTRRTIVVMAVVVLATIGGLALYQYWYKARGTQARTTTTVVDTLRPDPDTVPETKIWIKGSDP